MLDLSTVVLVLIPPRSASRNWSLVAVPKHVAGDGHFGEARTEQELWELFARALDDSGGELDEWIWIVGADGRTRGRVLPPRCSPEAVDDPDADCTRLARVA